MARLALSGGGFRATLFHLGVVRYLCESGRLSAVTDIVSVSGGSVLAAHLVLHWDDYVNPETFGNRARELVRLVQRDVRNRVFIRWLMPLFITALVLPLGLIMLVVGGGMPTWSAGLAPLGLLIAVGIFFLGLFARVKALTNQYRSLLKGALLRDLSKDTKEKRRRPSLSLATTSLTTGDLCWFDAKGFHWRNSAGPGTPPKYFPYGQCEVARAVAASSAFPPAFDPVLLAAKDLGSPAGFPADGMRLTDGGVYDNLGAELSNIITMGGGADRLIVSDAEQPFGDEVHQQYKLLVIRVSRSTDIMMHRISQFQFPNEAAADRVRLQDAIPDTNRDPLLTDAKQSRIMRVRTDLDRFSRAEIQLLMHQGYARARATFGQGPSPLISWTKRPPDKELPYVNSKGGKDRWLPFDQKQLGRQNASALEGSATRRVWRPLLFAWTAWPVWVFCIVPLMATYAYVALGQTALPTKIEWEEGEPNPKDINLLDYLYNNQDSKKGPLLLVKSEPIGKETPGLFGLIPRRPTSVFRLALPDWPDAFAPTIIRTRRRPGKKVYELKPGKPDYKLERQLRDGWDFELETPTKQDHLGKQQWICEIHDVDKDDVLFAVGVPIVSNPDKPGVILNPKNAEDRNLLIQMLKLEVMR